MNEAMYMNIEIMQNHWFQSGLMICIQLRRQKVASPLVTLMPLQVYHWMMVPPGRLPILSRSSDLSSFTLKTTGYDYPGDVHNVVHQVAGDNIFVAWVSKYCDGGTPLYTLL